MIYIHDEKAKEIQSSDNESLEHTILNFDEDVLATDDGEKYYNLNIDKINEYRGYVNTQKKKLLSKDEFKIIEKTELALNAAEIIIDKIYKVEQLKKTI